MCNIFSLFASDRSYGTISLLSRLNSVRLLLPLLKKQTKTTPIRMHKVEKTDKIIIFRVFMSMSPLDKLSDSKKRKENDE